MDNNPNANCESSLDEELEYQAHMQIIINFTLVREVRRKRDAINKTREGFDAVLRTKRDEVKISGAIVEADL
ncbi:MAG: hypothetical protein AB7F19_04215 [Candidatus Babeliales bacterium]